MAGGSEFRCIEISNGLSKYDSNEVFLMAEKRVSDKCRKYINSKVKIIENCFTSPKYFYEADRIIIINSDSREFSTLDYWMGKSPRHSISIDMSQFKNKKMYFLYNFIVSPSRHLNDFIIYGIKPNIITTNIKFFDEITKQDRYEKVRILPRYILGSPIDPLRHKIFVRQPLHKVTFGMHSKRLDNKWNDEIHNLITEINARYTPNQVEFRFMGIKSKLAEKLKKIDNVVCLKEDEELVSDFLSKLDIFLFFPSWKREEPWARVIAEAMVSGCPIIALDKGGTKDQVLAYNNGFLCKKYKDYHQRVVYFLEHKNIIPIMSKNSIRISKDFYTDNMIKKLMEIL